MTGICFIYRLPGNDGYYQPARDGKRFLVLEPEGAPGALPMVAVQNWAARLGK